MRRGGGVRWDDAARGATTDVSAAVCVCFGRREQCSRRFSIGNIVHDDEQRRDDRVGITSKDGDDEAERDRHAPVVRGDEHADPARAESAAGEGGDVGRARWHALPGFPW